MHHIGAGCFIMGRGNMREKVKIESIEALQRGIEENKKFWKETANRINEQNIEYLKKKISQLKAENEAIKRQQGW